jgi:hypothetical protein
MKRVGLLQSTVHCSPYSFFTNDTFYILHLDERKNRVLFDDADKGLIADQENWSISAYRQIHYGFHAGSGYPFTCHASPSMEASDVIQNCEASLSPLKAFQ